MTHSECRARRREIAAAVRGGLTANEAMGRYGVGRHMVLDACHEHGVEVPRKPRRRKANPFRVYLDLKAGRMTLDAIGREHGLSKQRVHQIREDARAAGLELPDRGAGRAEVSAREVSRP